MKIFLLVIVCLISYAHLLAQDSLVIENMIQEDHYLIDLINNENMFISRADKGLKYFEIIRITKEPLYLSDHKSGSVTGSITLFVINIKFNNEAFLGKLWESKNEIEDNTFEYIVLKSQGDYHRLFGFVFSDIDGVFKRTYDEKGNLKRLINELVQLKLLNPFQSMILRSCLKYNKQRFSRWIKRPCVVYSCFKKELGIRQRQTIILSGYLITPLHF